MAGDEIGTPRWVKLFGLIALVLTLLVVVHLLSGGGAGTHSPLGSSQP